MSLVFLPRHVVLLFTMLLLAIASDSSSAHSVVVNEDTAHETAARDNVAGVESALDENGAGEDADSLTPEQMRLVRSLEQKRVEAIDQVIGSVIAIYGLDRSGGGSGVIIDPSGIALTNHHVIIGAGVRGWGGLADGELYRWDLIGTDPGGDVAIIQMHGRDDFPFTPLGDSDDVRVGDWALAMGNPFILTEDQKPTVTLGIVSGVKRYQPGAGQNQLVYGNCIQVDSSINPGNSGGPLFNLDAEVIGINGRGSFKERGRVNVGLGYAISSNQIKNFIPDLLATKLVEHGTLDASFSDRGGKVVCSTINRDAPVAMKGLELGDELIEFEGVLIENANQFTNLICTLPEDWPAHLRIRKEDQTELDIHVRLFGLPYARPGTQGERPDDGPPPSEEERQQQELQQAMVDLLSAEPGVIRDNEANCRYAEHIMDHWLRTSSELLVENADQRTADFLKITDDVFQGDVKVGTQQTWLAADGRFRVLVQQDGRNEDDYRFDGETYSRWIDGRQTEYDLSEVRSQLPVVAANGMLSTATSGLFEAFGDVLIDGGDKAGGGNAWRISRTDRAGDSFYFWLRMYGEDGLPAPQLVKACAEKDCDRRDGGVLFEQWQPVAGCSGWLIPARRAYVVGIEENVTVRFQMSSAEVLDNVEDSMFFFGLE